MKKLERRTGTSLDEHLRRKIKAWIERHGLSAARFGRDALGDPGFVGALRRGRRVRLATADRVLVFMGEAPLGPVFRSEVESYLAANGNKLHLLGEEALGDPSFVSRLRRGASPRLATIERVRARMAAHGVESPAVQPDAIEMPGSIEPFTGVPKAGAGPERKGEKHMNANAKNYLSTREAADWLGLSPRTLDRYRVTGDGPAFHRLGSRVRYLLADLEAWAQAGRRTSTSDDGSGPGAGSRGRRSR